MSVYTGKEIHYTKPSRARSVQVALLDYMWRVRKERSLVFLIAPDGHVFEMEESGYMAKSTTTKVRETRVKRTYMDRMRLLKEGYVIVDYPGNIQSPLKIAVWERNISWAGPALTTAHRIGKKLGAREVSLLLVRRKNGPELVGEELALSMPALRLGLAQSSAWAG